MDISSFFSSLSVFLFLGVAPLYLCGEAVLGFAKRTTTGWERFVIALWLGICVFIAVAYGAAMLSFRLAVLPTIVALSFAGSRFLWNFSWKYLKSGWQAPHWFLVSLATLFSLFVTTSGWMTSNGLVLRGVNSVDGIWNLALIEELKHAFPPEHPGIAGVPLRGYHLLYNLLVADVSRVSGISVVGLHFHFLPMMMAILLVYGVYSVSLRLTGKGAHSVWATFFALAGGSFSYVLPLFWGKSVSLDDALGITQPFSLLVSASFVLSLVSIVYTWIFLDMYGQHPSWRWGAFVGVFAGLSVGMKVYAGMILLPTIAWFVFVRVSKRQDISSLGIALAATLSAVVVFAPLNGSYGFLRYQPLWPPHRVMQGVLDFTQWELKRQALESMGATLGLMKLEAIAIAIFIFGNLGTRLVGLVGLCLRKISWKLMFFQLLVIAALISLTLPMFFLQPIGAFNMIQFFWYFLVFTGLLAGWGWSLTIQRARVFWQIVLSVFLLIATIPSAGEKAMRLFGGPPYAIPAAEMAFYRELRRVGAPGDMVLVVPAIDRYTEADIRDWFYRTGPAIPAFSGKRTFLSNEVVQFPYDEWVPERIRLLNIFLLGFNDRLTEGKRRAEALKQLQILEEKYSIDFIVVPYGAQPWFIGRPWLRFLFANTYGTIYQVHGLPQ